MILNLSNEMRKSDVVPFIGILTDREGTLKDIGKAAIKLGIEVLSIPLRNKFGLSSFLIVHDYLKSQRIDLVHSHGYKPTILSFLPSKALGIPLIVTCHLWTKSGLKLKLYHRMEAWIMKFLPLIIGVSEQICREIVGKGVDRQRVRLIHNGIDLSNYRPYPREETLRFIEGLKIGPDDFVLGTVGRLKNQKAHHYLISAIKVLKDMGVPAKCVIIGEGDLRGPLEQQVQELGLKKNVFLPGYREDVLNVLEHFSIFVLTSLDEGLPMVLLEAMAKGKPIITTPVGAIRNVIRHGENGLLYDVGDVDKLVEGMLSLRNDSSYAARLGAAARETVERDFSSRNMTAEYLKLYRSMLRAGNRHAEL